MKLSGWGRYPVLSCRLAHLRERKELDGVLNGNATVIARGNGRSYGDAALNPDLTLSMRGMDRMQAFDANTGLLTCEAGVLLADVLATFVPRGWFPSVVPGTKFVTIGGMIAADVHGKNHHRDGSFGSHVGSLTLATSAGVVHCSRAENAELFRATLGGMGLTGVILAASFRLRRLETAFVSEEISATGNLDETMALLESSADWPYSGAWIDCLARGGQRGRSLVVRSAFMVREALPARFSAAPLAVPARPRWTVPFDAPSALLNPVSIRAFNEWYFRRGAGSHGARPVHFNRSFFPLDGVGAWNRLYGRRGFVQYQCVLPKGESSTGLSALLDRVAAAGRAGQVSFLAVLKLFGAQGEGLLSFPMEGYTLALDFPMRSGTLALLASLDEITHRHGGRVYLAKDACSSAELVREGYPLLPVFSRIRAETAGAKFTSALSRRLRL